MSCCHVASFVTDTNDCDCVLANVLNLRTQKIRLRLAAAPSGGVVKAGTVLSLDTLAPDTAVLAANPGNDTTQRPYVLACDVRPAPDASYPLTVEVLVISAGNVNQDKLIFWAGATAAQIQTTKLHMQSVGIQPLPVVPAPNH